MFLIGLVNLVAEFRPEEEDLHLNLTGPGPDLTEPKPAAGETDMTIEDCSSCRFISTGVINNSIYKLRLIPPMI